MSMDDGFPDQIFFRRPLPKRRISNLKARRYNIHYGPGQNFHDNSLIQKIYEFDSGEDCTEEVREEMEKRLSLLKETEGDGLCPKSVWYSEGKKKRWEEVAELRNKVPEPEYPTESSSVAQIETGNILIRGECLKPSFEKVTRITTRTMDGEEKTLKGNMHKNMVYRNTSGLTKPHLKTEYHIYDQKLSTKLKNSSLYPPFKMSWDDFSDIPIEEHRLKLDVLRDFWGNWQTAYRVRFEGEIGPRCYSTDELYRSPEQEESEDEDAPKPRGITLGDFMPVQLNPRRFRSLSEGWDFVQDE